MKAGLLLRIARLERTREDEATQVHHRVLRIPWDALDYTPEPSEVHAGIVRTVILPEKAPSAEAWAAWVRQRWENKTAATAAQKWWDARPWLKEGA